MGRVKTKGGSSRDVFSGLGRGGGGVAEKIHS